MAAKKVKKAKKIKKTSKQKTIEEEKEELENNPDPDVLELLEKPGEEDQEEDEEEYQKPIEEDDENKIEEIEIKDYDPVLEKKRDLERKKIIEAALFTSSKAIDVYTLSRMVGLSAYSSVRVLVQELMNEYDLRDTALEIIENENGLFRMRVKEDFEPDVMHLAASPKFRKADLKTLALIAYKQPVPQPTIIKLRNNKAYNEIKRLEKAGFVKSTKKGNFNVLTTTKKFIKYFGTNALNLKNQLNPELKQAAEKVIEKEIPLDEIAKEQQKNDQESQDQQVNENQSSTNENQQPLAENDQANENEPTNEFQETQEEPIDQEDNKKTEIDETAMQIPLEETNEDQTDQPKDTQSSNEQ